MKKKNFKNIIGLTLVEILIGICITTIMMGAMYTSYNVVNQSYSRVTEKAKISRAIQRRTRRKVNQRVRKPCQQNFRSEL